MTDREQIRRDDFDAQNEKNLRILKLIRDDHGWALSRILRAEELEDELSDWPEGREGMAVVFDSTTRAYLGCIGIESWNILVLEGDVE